MLRDDDSPAAQPAACDFHAAEGRSWRLTVSPDGARITRFPTSDASSATTADTTSRGTANELTLTLYGRIPMDSLKIDGDRGLIDLPQAW
ncbi:hypothetical protein [Streptomyces sp. NBC_00576]|uniref:hypothetical protein n=1 Tax=Streptomyces sp. NBC_00576 TaxID=2903665 RepID=UPI002E80357C|nr:hypothetical protein [Streptomyces sp. NBC_00576]